MRRKIFLFLIALTALILIAPAMANQDTTPPPATIGGDINDAGMIVLVAGLTQAIKKGLEALFKHAVSPVFAVALSIIVGFFTVSITALQIGHSFNLNLLLHFVAATGVANGLFLFLDKILKAIGIKV
jgi:hypothetical protein